MKITVLAENTSCREGIGCEHGLSLFIETNRCRILFDMGQSTLFAENALRLGVDLSKVELAVLSHGHYDHGGGISCFLKQNSASKVCVNPYVFGEYYHGTEKYIGLDPSLKGNSRLVLVEKPLVLHKGITLYPVFSLPLSAGFDSCGLTRRVNGQWLPDDFLHEQYLEIIEGDKRILFSGCSHRGILNITRCFRPDVLVGGFHFSKMPLDSTLDGYAAQLNGLGTEFYTCHCTGVEQYQRMKKHMERLHYLSAGMTVEL